MLLCGVAELEAGWTVGVRIAHPLRTQTTLVERGTALTASMIAELSKLGIDRVWVTSDWGQSFVNDLGAALSEEQQAIFEAMRDGFLAQESSSVSKVSVNGYTDRITGLIKAALTGKKYASLAAQMGPGAHPLFAHCANVSYLCVVASLELESYLMQERPLKSAREACDHNALGLAGLLHDVGKLREEGVASGSAPIRHEAHLAKGDRTKAYCDHTERGYAMLDARTVPASVRVAVRDHHQRWDGYGWPKRASRAGAPLKTLRGKDIHVYARIVGACNLLDNLLHDASGLSRAPVEALSLFASSTYDGWCDPVVRKALLEVVHPFAVGTLVVLSDGTACGVTEPRPDCPCLPKVCPLTENATAIDLASPNESRRIATHEGRDVSRCYYEPGALLTRAA